MRTVDKRETSGVVAFPATRKHAWYALMAKLFGGSAVDEVVATRMHFNGAPEVVWDTMMFYEQVQGKPPLPMRWVMTKVLGTEGDKMRAGNVVRCLYEGGELLKRITWVEDAKRIEFEVVGQTLGMEVCAIALRGSYQMWAENHGTAVIATTWYRSYLHPRWFWRRVEKLLVGQLHRHVMRGMQMAMLEATPVRMFNL